MFCPVHIFTCDIIGSSMDFDGRCCKKMWVDPIWFVIENYPIHKKNKNKTNYHVLRFSMKRNGKSVFNYFSTVDREIFCGGDRQWKQKLSLWRPPFLSTRPFRQGQFFSREKETKRLYQWKKNSSSVYLFLASANYPIRNELWHFRKEKLQFVQ